MAIVLILLIVLVVILIVTMVKIVPQSKVYVIENLGKYQVTWQSGIHFKTPFIQNVAAKLDIREQVLNFPPQPVITKDNVTMQIDTVIYVYITEPRSYMYGVANPISAIENLTATTLRNIIGDLELDETLTSRELINLRIRSVLDEATAKWGLKITRVEVKNIVPPKDIQVAMEKQMRAERERREKILTAEGTKTSSILEAEGFKEAQILRAEAEKTAQILRAEGEAKAIIQVQTAYAEALERLTASNPSQEIIKLKGYEAFEKMADGQASKLIIPADMKDLASLAAGFKEVTNLVNDNEKNL